LYSDAAIHGREFLQIGFNRHSSYDHELNSTRGGSSSPLLDVKNGGEAALISIARGAADSPF
jgi:hypothetical protein